MAWYELNIRFSGMNRNVDQWLKRLFWEGSIRFNLWYPPPRTSQKSNKNGKPRALIMAGQQASLTHTCFYTVHKLKMVLHRTWDMIYRTELTRVGEHEGLRRQTLRRGTRRTEKREGVVLKCCIQETMHYNHST